MKIILMALVVLIFPLAACREDAPAPGGSSVVSLVNAHGARHDFTVELAVSQQQMAKGLMNRTEMPPDVGMLFWFGKDERETSFWMKNTYIPLDMLFIRADGRIHHIHANARPLDETSIPSNGPVAAVLEINGGLAAQMGLKPGDMVHHPLFGNALAP
jgi:uncharacterized membrane protein (UPF0127 family)